MAKQYLFFLLFVSAFFYGQNDITITGKITSNASDVNGITIINLTTKEATISTIGGDFSIKVNENDTLFFSAIHLEKKKYTITKQDITSKNLNVYLKESIVNLQDIVVTKYPKINAEDLGIIPRGQKTYTPAEAKLAAAGEDFKWYSPLLIPLGGMSFDGLLNDITGRKKALKLAVLIERKQMAQEKILDYFDKESIIKLFKIPEENVEGFLFYVVENQDVINSLSNKNKTELTFVLSQVSVEFLKTIEPTTDTIMEEN